MADSPSTSRSPSGRIRRRSSVSSRALALVGVNVTPAKIALHLDDEGVVKTEITIRNSGQSQILWKLQTTEPKKYSVSPTKGIINSNEMGIAEIQLLNLYVEQALHNARTGQGDIQRSTKFRLQVVRTMGEDLPTPPSPADLDVNMFDERWQHVVETGGKAAVFYEKLQCLFVYPRDIDPDNSASVISPTRSRASVEGVETSDVRPLVADKSAVSSNSAGRQPSTKKGCCVIS